jgi:hypothetical protein
MVSAPVEGDGDDEDDAPEDVDVPVAGADPDEQADATRSPDRDRATTPARTADDVRRDGNTGLAPLRTVRD